MLDCAVTYSAVSLPKLNGMIVACCSQDNWFTGTICVSHIAVIIWGYLRRSLHENSQKIYTKAKELVLLLLQFMLLEEPV